MQKRSNNLKKVKWFSLNFLGDTGDTGKKFHLESFNLKELTNFILFGNMINRVIILIFNINFILILFKIFNKIFRPTGPRGITGPTGVTGPKGNLCDK